MTLGALLLLLVGVAVTAWMLVRTRRLSREAAVWDDGGHAIELPEDVRGLLDQGEGDLAARLLARRLQMPLEDARAVIAAQPAQGDP